jgi:ferredoxin
MTFTVSVDAGGIEFPCEPGETVLDAAERAGYALPYSCRKGVCSTCEGDLRGGESPWARSISEQIAAVQKVAMEAIPAIPGKIRVA